MVRQFREDPNILAAAEKQMHAQAMASEIEDRANRHKSECKRVIEYVTISREAGAGGSEIGRAVSQRLGWPVYDKNLLDHVAEKFCVSRMMLDLVDETRSNWVFDVLGTWMDHKIVPHEKFVAYLGRVLIEATKQGNAVFVGRAAQFLLPRSKILAVRIVASEKYRVQQIMANLGMTEVAARQFIHEVDEGRREFVERFFHHDLADPHLYDLVINVDRCGPQGAADEIISALNPQTALQHA